MPRRRQEQQGSPQAAHAVSRSRSHHHRRCAAHARPAPLLAGYIDPAEGAAAAWRLQQQLLVQRVGRSAGGWAYALWYLMVALRQAMKESGYLQQRSMTYR